MLTSVRNPSAGVIGAALATVAAAGFLVLRQRSAARNDFNINDEDDEIDEEPVLSVSETVEIFNELFLGMQNVVAKLSQQIAAIQSAGQKIPDAQVKQIMTQEFDRAGYALQKQTYEKFDVDEEDVKEAVEYYGSDKKLSAVINRFKSLYETVSGNATGPVVAVPDDFSPSDLVRAAETYFSAMTESMKEVVGDFKARGEGDFRNPAVAQRLHAKFAEVVNDAGDAALDNVGVPMGLFKAALEKYAKLPQVGTTLQMLQMKQTQELMALGVPM